MTKPTLYHYFGSKRGLAETLARERYEPFIARLAEAAEYSRDLPRALERVTSAYFHSAASEPLLWRLLLSVWLASPEAEAVRVFATGGAEEQRIVEGLFRSASQDHRGLRGHEGTYAFTLLGMLRSYVGLALDGKLRLDGPTAHRAAHQFSHGIYS